MSEQITHVLYALVEKVERRTNVLRTWKSGDDIKQETVDIGWYVHFDGSRESLHFGYEPEAPFAPGDRVKITFQKEG